MRELRCSCSNNLVCSEATLIHYALQSLLYLYAWSLLAFALRLQTQANSVRPDLNPKFFDFPILRAQISPKLHRPIFLVKLFSCDQNFSSAMQILLHTVP